jgi:hypothetical protein
MEAHIRLLYNTFDVAFVPPQPTADTLVAFAARFGTTAMLEAVTEKSPARVAPESVAQLSGILSKQLNGRLIKQRTKVGELHLAKMRHRLARYGFTSWAPHMDGNSNSLFNIAHQDIAMESFRDLAGAGEYAWTGMKRIHVGNWLMQEKYYRNSVFNRLKNVYLAEERKPGKAADLKGRDTVCKRRNRVSARRYFTLICLMSNP